MGYAVEPLPKSCVGSAHEEPEAEAVPGHCYVRCRAMYGLHDAHAKVPRFVQPAYNISLARSSTRVDGRRAEKRMDDGAARPTDLGSDRAGKVPAAQLHPQTGGRPSDAEDILQEVFYELWKPTG